MLIEPWRLAATYRAEEIVDLEASKSKATKSKASSKEADDKTMESPNKKMKTMEHFMVVADPVPVAADP
jgi:hypothetical protein